MMTQTLKVQANGGVTTVLSGRLPIARLATIAALMLKPTRSDAEFHADMDALQVRGAWETDNDLQWSGYDYVSQAWLTIYIESEF